MLTNLFILLTIFLPNNIECSFFDWLGWSDSKGPNLTYKGVPLFQIPFEELSPEDKFLVEASKIVGFELSELDTCQHRIVMKLKSSCGSLSEEDLAKFSVNLLNCQSAVEGRKEFPCEENMTLKECTKLMDAETWNAYHIMNNRARAVCYASRQQQFRALAEMTINKLMSTSHVHIEALSSLQKESDTLKGGASLTLSEIEKSQRDVLSRQRSLASISMIVGEEMQRSLTLANDQKELLTDFKKDLSNLFSKLQTKLDQAEKQIGESTRNVKTSHSDLMKDMKDISVSTSQILQQIDASSKKVLENNNVALEQFKYALENIKEINLSIGYILSVVETIKQRSSVISNIVGDKGENLEMFAVTSLHLICLMAAMVVLSFLSAPWTSRLSLLIASSLNTYSTVRSLTQDHFNYPKVSLIHFYVGFLAVFICDWLIRIVSKMIINGKVPRIAKSNGISNDQLSNSFKKMSGLNNVLDPRNEDVIRPPLMNNNRSHFDDTPVSKVNSWLSENRRNDRFRSSNFNGYIKESNVEDDVYSHVSSVAKSAVSGRSVDARSVCTAVSKHTGQRCRKKAMKSSNFCSIHDR